nr:transposase [Corynebacterium sp. HMSC28B08]
MVNQVAVDACRQLVDDNPSHLDGVRILGVDEHVWKHTRKPGQPSTLVTILVDLTPLADGRGPARLPDIRPGRSADVLRTWLQERNPGLRSQVQVVTMDGFTGYATAVDQVLHPREEGDGSVPRRASGRGQAHWLPAEAPT